MLREAVRSLLTRREMEYIIQRGKGAFLVNATSGHELVGNSSSSSTIVHGAVDSKVIVTTSTDEFCANKVVRHKNVNHHHRQTVPPSQSVPSVTSSLSSMTILECTLTPAEVAADDDLMERIKTKSAQEHTQSIRHEQRELSRAISVSKREVDRLQQEEEEQLKAILQQSQCELSLRHNEEEEKRLAEVLLRSEEEDEIQRRNEEQRKKEDDERLAAALEASQEEEKAVREEELLQLKRAISISQLEVNSSQHDENDDKALHEALVQSMHDMNDNSEDSQLNQVLEKSLRQETMSEDELIQQALFLSLNETYDTVATID